jgi:hypothetical protein
VRRVVVGLDWVLVDVGEDGEGRLHLESASADDMLSARSMRVLW